MLGTFRSFAISGLAIVALITLATGPASADPIIDGQLLDWGVKPFSNWVPNPGIMYVEQNWRDGYYPYGGETYDIEAFYLSPELTRLKAAIVTSFPEAGAADPYNTSIWIQPGDLLLDFDRFDGHAWEWAITLNGPNKGDIYHNPVLTLPQGYVGLPQNGPACVDVAHSGAPVGHAQVAWFNYGDLEGYGSDTFGIEVSANWDQFGAPVGMMSILAHHAIGCGNDSVDLAAVGSPVPEPATFSLLLLGGLVFASRKIARRRQWNRFNRGD